MGFRDLFRKRTLDIMRQEGITKQDIQAVRGDPRVAVAVRDVEICAERLGDYYARNTWVGENRFVEKSWEQNEDNLRHLARVIKTRSRR